MNLTAFARDERLRTRLARALDFTGAAGRAAAPVVDLLVRLALAKAFFTPAALAGFVPFSTMLPTLQDGMLPSQPLIIGAGWLWAWVRLWRRPSCLWRGPVWRWPGRITA